ncbi:MAG TPA: polynucleotide adenylyltransferase PcnB [Candidatus Binataceae bacterium]|nr:polynucleotide adenylyltransferase PcnB [Candidatus Binataceae bacterium]
MEPHILERAEHPISRRDIDPDVLKVLYRLIKAGQLAYLVGGGVRDLMLGRRPKDFDVATDAHPQQVRDLFRNSRLIGRRFRLVHVFFGPKNIEVATFRKQAEGVDVDDPLIRHDNTFGTPEEDAFRRDFTVNSLFYDPRTFRVIDFAGGVADLRARLIRTIGDPELRMREDPVRMLRAVRFAAKLSFDIEPATLAAIERHRADLQKASVPRLVEETYRTIGQTGAARALVLMESLGLLEQLMPWLSTHLKAEASALIDARTTRNLAALGGAMSSGTPPPHEVILAAMFLDLMTAGNPRDYIPTPLRELRNGPRTDLVGELRRRGFARADTDFMRLIIEAMPHLLRPSRRTRKLMRRPYFEHARRLCELVAPVYGADLSTFTRFLSDPEAFLANPHDAPMGEGGPKRRRRRRGRRRPAWQRKADRAAAPSDASSNGAAPAEASDASSDAVPVPSPTRTE